MTEPPRKKRTADRLTALYPTFRTRIERSITALEADGLRPRIPDLVRGDL